MKFQAASSHLVRLLCVLLMVLALAPAIANQDQNKRASKPGDICIICGADHSHINEVMLHKGRWVPACVNCSPKLADADTMAHYFKKLQPRGALYQEDAILNDEGSMRTSWFWFGIWVLVALLSAALSAGIALKKGLSPVKWFFSGLAFSLAGVVMAMMQSAESSVELPAHLGKIPTTAAPKICPNCSAENHPSAKNCSNCGYAFSDAVESEVERL